MADIVIGSGPSGIAVATALLARGRQVVMLDGGKRLEPDRAALRDKMAAMAPQDWSAADHTAWQAPQFATPAGQIRRYGSDFAMEAAAATFEAGADRFALRASRAAGGLSNLWGSAILPYHPLDMAGWPVSAADLAPHYRALGAFLPASGRPDDLAPDFPLQPAAGQHLAPSPQAGVLLDRMERARAGLAALGITAGMARTAVASGCRACGQCLHGCPWGLIWSAGGALAHLRAHPAFTYRPGAIAMRFSETGAQAEVTLTSGETIRGERLFIGAGVLETARLVLASRPGDAVLTLRDSQHGFLPALHLWRAPRRPDRGPFHTLPQAFTELRDPRVSPHLVHAQIYTWNEFFEQDLIANYARRLPGSTPFFRALARRLIVAQLFLHSDHSARVRLRLAADGRLAAQIDATGATAIFDAAARAMGRGLALVGLRPLSFAKRMAPAGSSFHAGATVPMAAEPGANDSDVLGRPKGYERIHLIDASILPAIPATTITLAVMANAHRIGTLCP